MSLREQGWWDELVRRLHDERLSLLAKEYGVALEALAEALAGVGAGGPADQAPWWPEARRMLKKGVSIREVARRFSTNPRRMRRALARAGLRAGGEEVSGKGVAKLAPWREQLGRVPDAHIAKSAKVTVEAVKGERRRLRIPAFRPDPGYRPGEALDEDAWAMGPVRPRRERMRLNTSGLQVVRRPGRSEGEDRPEPREIPPEGIAPPQEKSEAPSARPDRAPGQRRVVRPPASPPETPAARGDAAAPAGLRGRVIRSGADLEEHDQRARESYSRSARVGYAHALIRAELASAHPNRRLVELRERETEEERKRKEEVEKEQQQQRDERRRQREGHRRVIRDAPASLLEGQDQGQQKRRYTRQDRGAWREVSEDVISQIEQQAAAEPAPAPEPSFSSFSGLGVPLRPEDRQFQFRRLLDQVRSAHPREGARRVRIARATVSVDPAAPPRRRGRPPKIRTPEELAALAAPRRRGRPPKIRPPEDPTLAEAIEGTEGSLEVAAPRRRGRPPKIRTPEELAALAMPRRRGRPPKPRPAPEAAPEVAPVARPVARLVARPAARPVVRPVARLPAPARPPLARPPATLPRISVLAHDPEEGMVEAEALPAGWFDRGAGEQVELTVWQVYFPDRPALTITAPDLADAALRLTELLPEDQLPWASIRRIELA